MDKTFLKRLLTGPLLLSAAALIALGTAPAPLRAQTATAEAPAPQAEEAPQPLSPEELDILVARIALYPDELVALISAASLYPLQVIEAERFLEESKTKKDLKPKASWDGSIISLLNYPEIVKMMSDDLDWTQLFGEAIVNQQEDVLNAIQQLREQAVANGVIKTNDKVKVTKEVEDGRQNIIIEPASTEYIYVPQYQPEMFYEPGYAYQPVTYYPDPYPYYWNPAATFFAGAVTGAIWTAAVDWNNGFWGWGWNNNHYHGGHGNNWGNDINIDCNKCIIGSDFNGKINAGNIDWRNVDRSKINFDKNQFNKINNTNIRNEFKKNDFTNVKGDKLGNGNKLGSGNKGNLQRPTTLPGNVNGIQTKDIRKSTLEGLNKKPTTGFKPTDKMARPGNGNVGNLGGNGGGNLGNITKPGNGGGNLGGNLGNITKPGNGGANIGDMARPSDKMAKPNLDRPVGKPRPGGTPDYRPSKPSPMGEVTRGRDAKMQSTRGNKSMGGGGINRPDFNPGGGGGGGKMKGGGGGGGKKFVPPRKGGGGGGGGRGRRR